MQSSEPLPGSSRSLVAPGLFFAQSGFGLTPLDALRAENARLRARAEAVEAALERSA